MLRCAVISTLNLFSAKWKPCILSHLMQESLRFSELKKRIPDITKKMLSQHLTELENDNLVSRRVYSEKPVKVIYAITEKGESLKDIFRMLEEWGLKHQENTMSIQTMLSITEENRVD